MSKEERQIADPLVGYIRGPSDGQQVGYIRVSSADQNTDRQLAGIELNRVFTEKVSAVSGTRPQLAACFEYCRQGDVLHIHSMDRLARSVVDLHKLIQSFKSKRVSIHFHKENLFIDASASVADTSMSTFLISVLGAVAQFERDLLLERQREGIAIAKAKGKYKGRKPSLDEIQTEAMLVRAKQGATIADLSREFSVSRDTVYRYLKKHFVWPGVPGNYLTHAEADAYRNSVA